MNYRGAIALGFLGLAVASLVSARTALAEKMVFLAASSPDRWEVKTSFEADHGNLILDPSGSTVEALRVEIVTAPSGRSPASTDSSPVVKILTLTGVTSYHLSPQLTSQCPGQCPEKVVQIRILAP